MDSLYVLEHIALLIKISIAAFHGTHEWLFVGVDAEMGEKLAETAEELSARFPIVLS